MGRSKERQGKQRGRSREGGLKFYHQLKTNVSKLYMVKRENKKNSGRDQRCKKKKVGGGNTTSKGCHNAFGKEFYEGGVKKKGKKSEKCVIHLKTRKAGGGSDLDE